MVDQRFSNLHEDLGAVKGLLEHPSVSKEMRERLEELKQILEERLLCLLSESEVATVS